MPPTAQVGCASTSSTTANGSSARVWTSGEVGRWAKRGRRGRSRKRGRQSLEHGRLYNLYGLHELPALGHKIVVEPRQTVRGRTYDVLRLELSDGFRTWRFIDRETGQMALQRDHRAIHPDVDPTPIWMESRNSDFRTVEGVAFPFASRQHELETDQWMQTTQILSLELSPPLTDQELRRPAQAPSGSGLRLGHPAVRHHRQLAQPDSGRRVEDRVADRRRDADDRRLPRAGGGQVLAVEDARRSSAGTSGKRGTRYCEKCGLAIRPSSKRDRLEERAAEALDDGPLDLVAQAVGVHDGAALERRDQRGATRTRRLGPSTSTSAQVAT